MALDVELLSEGREFDLKEPGDMALGGTGGGGCLFGLYNDPLTFKNNIFLVASETSIFPLDLIVPVW